MYYKTTKELLAFIKKSPTAFHAVEEMQARLTEDGFQVLSEKEHWKITPGGKYVVTRNHSALIAFTIPEKESWKFHIIASHSDSPSFKIDLLLPVRQIMYSIHLRDRKFLLQQPKLTVHR